MGDLSTPDSVQKLQTALHAKAKAEPDFRFYALYDKISREDTRHYAYAHCRSNKGAPGVDRQDFEAVEAYGVERWLGELALALRQETYRPDLIRRVFIPKANGCGWIVPWKKPTIEDGGHARPRREDKRRGIPQGSTPLAAAGQYSHMRRFVLGWKMFGLERTLGARLVTYADDLVILCRRGKAEAALQSLREIMGKLKPTVNEEKTRICKVPEGEFDFLGYTFGRMFSARTGQARIGYRPSKKSIQRAVEKVHALTGRSRTWQETTTLVGKVNRTLRG